MGVAFVPFRQSILFRTQEAVHIISNVRLEVCDYSASYRIAEVVWLQHLCNIWCISSISNSATSSTLTHSTGMAREGGYTRHSARSLPSGFPTQMPYTRWTLFASRFFFLSFDFHWFSFFLRLLLICSLCMPLYIVWKRFLFSSNISISCLTFSSLASMHLICSTLKS